MPPRKSADARLSVAGTMVWLSSTFMGCPPLVDRWSARYLLCAVAEANVLNDGGADSPAGSRHQGHASVEVSADGHHRPPPSSATAGTMCRPRSSIDVRGSLPST